MYDTACYSKIQNFQVKIVFSVCLKGYQKVVDKLSVKREKIADIQKALATADVNQDSKLDFEEWRTELKS